MLVCLLYAEKLNLKVASEYNYLKQSGCLTIDGVDDAKKFQMLLVLLLLLLTCCGVTPPLSSLLMLN